MPKGKDAKLNLLADSRLIKDVIFDNDLIKNAVKKSHKQNIELLKKYQNFLWADLSVAAFRIESLANHSGKLTIGVQTITERKRMIIPLQNAARQYARNFDDLKKVVNFMLSCKS